MDESRFRDLMREAIGDESMQPWLAAAIRDRVAARRPTSSRLPWLIAAALLVVVVAALLVPQLTANRSHAVVPAATPSPAPSPTQVDPLGCRLPVGVAPGEFGFIDTRTGQFTRDASAPVASFAADSGALSPVSYSTALHVWVPVQPTHVSPNGQLYAWVLGHDLHVTEIATGIDSVLWTAKVDVYFWRWDAQGILVFPELSPSEARAYLIDPASGAAVEVPVPRYGFTGLLTDPRGGSGFRSIGMDAEGRMLWYFYGYDRPGNVDWVFYETSPGQRVYIFKGTQGDATGFDPDAAYADATGVWFTDHLHSAMWHWSTNGGLRKISITGLPASTVLELAGPCF